VVEAAPVSPAPRFTSVCWCDLGGAWAARVMLREISWVAAALEEQGAAIVEAISEILPMVPPIFLDRRHRLLRRGRHAAICVPISSVALAVLAASALTS
jgi:hypothetical protein